MEAKAVRDGFEARRKAKAKQTLATVLAMGSLLTLLPLLIIWLAEGCVGGPCDDRGECAGLIAECTCTGAYANHTGRFCDGLLGDMIMRSEYNDATVQAVTYAGSPTDLSWELQHELCAAAGRATPGSSAVGSWHGRRRLQDESYQGRRRLPAINSNPSPSRYDYQDEGCAYSSSDNYAVTEDCPWATQNFTHVVGSLRGGVGYMCAGSIGTRDDSGARWFDDCSYQVRIEGTAAAGHWGTVTLSSGDAVFCSA